MNRKKTKTEGSYVYKMAKTFPKQAGKIYFALDSCITTLAVML